MQWLLVLLVACIVLSALQAVLVVLLVILAIMGLWGLYNRPRETFGFLAFAAGWTLLMQHPLLILAGAAIVCLASLLQNFTKN